MSRAGKSDADADRTLAIVLGTVAGLILLILVVVVVCYAVHHWPWLAVNRRNRILRAEMASFDGPYSADARSSTLRMSPRNGLEASRPSAPELTAINLTELDTDTARDQPVKAKFHYAS